MRSDIAGADYRRARRKAFMRGVLSWFKRSDNALLAFDDVRRGIHAQAQREGKGAVSLDGRLIDLASIRQAEVLVSKAKQIATAK